MLSIVLLLNLLDLFNQCFKAGILINAPPYLRNLSTFLKNPTQMYFAGTTSPT